MRARHLALILPLLTVAACGGGEPAGGPFDPTGAWELVSGESDGTPLPLVDGFRITLIVEGGQAGGTAACNSYGGEIALDGSSFALGQIARTEMYCFPDEVMESEAAYLDALARVDSGARDGDALTLTGPGVELAFTALPPVPTSDLTGTVWELDALVDGDAVSSVGGGPATLELTGDGRMAGSTGCRTFTGEWVARGDEIQVTSLAMEGECAPGLEAQDGHVIGVLSRFTATVDGGTLTLASGGGQGLVYRAP